MSRNPRRRAKLAIGFACGAMTVLGPCLPEDYFALSARNIAVALANGLVAAALAPVFDALSIPQDDTGTGTDSGADAGTTDPASGG